IVCHSVTPSLVRPSSKAAGVPSRRALRTRRSFGRRERLVPAPRQLVLRATPRVIGLDHRYLTLGGREVEIGAFAGLLLLDVRVRCRNPRLGPLQVGATLVGGRIALRPVERATVTEQSFVRLERGGGVGPVAAAATAEGDQRQEEAEECFGAKRA